MSDFRTGRHAVEASSLIGMPQLGLNGLNENWLMKEAGHRHWMAICGQAGVQSHEIIDGQGHRLYAAFVGIEWEGDPLGGVGENDRLDVRTELCRFSSKRFFSHNRFTASSGSAFTFQMVSIFVKKPVFDDNRTLASGQPDPLRAIEQTDTPEPARRLQDDWKSLKGEPVESSDLSIVHHVCPTIEFNGARMLYFANFQLIVDQAEWNALPNEDMQFASTERRRMFFYGNVNFDDVLEVRFHDVDWGSDVRAHRADLVRKQDGARLAVIETRKRLQKPD